MPRTFDEEKSFITRTGKVQWTINKGFVPNMNVSSHVTTHSLGLACR
jgi:hypothetical protein